ncbi:MAG: hypothetical protein IPL08_21850 [Saprospiraceae bacterium]|nr:hypothetical protein [Saprospiraceae bacterium]
MNDIYFMDISPRKKLKALIDLPFHRLRYSASATVFNDEWKFLQEPVIPVYRSQKRLMKKIQENIVRRQEGR